MIALEYGFELVTVVVGRIAADGQNFVDCAAGVPAFNVDKEMNRVCDAGLDGLVRQLDSALQDTTGQPGERLHCGVGVNGRKTPAVAGVQGLQEVEGFLQGLVIAGRQARFDDLDGIDLIAARRGKMDE